MSKFSFKLYFSAISICIFMSLHIFLSCKTESDHDTNGDVYQKIIGHRGTGSDDFPDKNPLLPRENTYDAMAFAFTELDGAETDIQMSADGTIWLWHDDFIGIDTSNCLPCLTDEQILQLLPEDKTIAKLVDVLNLLDSNPEKKYLSLDVKGHFPHCNCFNHTEYFDRMSDSIVAFVNRFDIEDRLMVETNYTEFLDFVTQKDKRIDCYLLGYSNLRNTIDFAQTKGYAGVSFNFNDTSFTESNMLYLRTKNLKIQLWSIYSQSGMDMCIELNPNFIQTGYFNSME